jgi:hypothetical protein
VNAAETIAAAIEKLETQRDAGTPGPWVDGEDTCRYDAAIVTHAAGSGIWADAVVRDDGFLDFHDAALVITLHRTIDPILTILRWFGPELDGAPDYTPPQDNPFWALACAVLGGDS